jgi:hypothetical protein
MFYREVLFTNKPLWLSFLSGTPYGYPFARQFGRIGKLIDLNHKQKKYQKNKIKS